MGLYQGLVKNERKLQALEVGTMKRSIFLSLKAWKFEEGLSLENGFYFYLRKLKED